MIETTKQIKVINTGGFNMQFYKFEGFTVDDNWSEENDSRRVMNEKIRKISMK